MRSAEALRRRWWSIRVGPRDSRTILRLLCGPLYDERGDAITKKKRPTLKALEAVLEQEVLAFENSAIRIGEILMEIKGSEACKTEAGYSTFKAYYYKARQLKRIEVPQEGRVWEKLNQGEEPVTRKRVSEGIRKEKATGTVTMYGKPYDLGKWGRDR